MVTTVQTQCQIHLRISFGKQEEVTCSSGNTGLSIPLVENILKNSADLILNTSTYKYYPKKHGTFTLNQTTKNKIKTLKKAINKN